MRMSADRLKQLKERSKLRRQLLAQQLGVEEQNFSSALGTKEDVGSASPGKCQSVDSLDSVGSQQSGEKVRGEGPFFRNIMKSDFAGKS